MKMFGGDKRDPFKIEQTRYDIFRIVLTALVHNKELYSTLECFVKVYVGVEKVWTFIEENSGKF